MAIRFGQGDLSLVKFEVVMHQNIFNPEKMTFP